RTSSRGMAGHPARARSVAHARGPGSGALSTRRLSTRRLDNLNEGTQSSPVPRLLLALLLTLALITPATAAPEGQLPYALHFSFQRYKGSQAKLLKERVREVEVVNPHRVRFHLAGPWPDFLTVYGTPATGAGWIVPKRYVEKVGDAGFLKAPVGLGPYRFVS